MAIGVAAEQSAGPGRTAMFGLPLLLIVALLLALAGCSGSAAAPPAMPPPAVVVGVPIKKQIVEWDEYVGRLDAVESVEVRARVSGHLKAAPFEEGQMVAQGELLAVIDPRPFEAAVRRFEADLAQAQAQVSETKTQLAQAEADQRAAQARVDLAKSQLARARTLYAKSVLTVEELEVREAEFLEAQANVDADAAKIASARAAIHTAEAAAQTAESHLAIARLDLEYTEIRSPIAGRVSRRLVTEGNYISGGSVGSTLLTTIVSLNPIHVYFDADEQAFLKYTRLAQNGQRLSSREVKNPVFVALSDEKQGYQHRGHMDFVDNRLDANTGTMRGRAILPNEDLVLTPGLFVRLRLPGSANYEAVLIPDQAIGSDQSEKFVFVVGSDRIVKRQIVELGPLAHGLRIVRSGLVGDEQIVLRGLQRVQPGKQVAVTIEPVVAKAGDGLPDYYEPVPKEEWLSRPRVDPFAKPQTPAPAQPVATTESTEKPAASVPETTSPLSSESKPKASTGPEAEAALEPPTAAESPTESNASPRTRSIEAQAAAEKSAAATDPAEMSTLPAVQAKKSARRGPFTIGL